MTGSGARATPVRGPSNPKGAPGKPILEPKTLTVNPMVVAGFVGAIVVAVGAALFIQFSTPAESTSSMVERERGNRVTGTNSRMVTGLNQDEGRMTATLEDDAVAPEMQPVGKAGPTDSAMQARIVELETALEEASREIPEVGALITQIAATKGRIAELDVSLRDAVRERERSEIDFERRLSDERSTLAAAHKDEIDQLQTAHDEAMAAVEGRLAGLLDEQAAASRAARIRSRSVLVNKGAPKADAAFGAPVVPGDPATSLGQGATFVASLLGNIDAIAPGSITAMVVSDVRSASGQAVLIPRGSTLQGRYRSDVSGEDGRVVVSWDEVTLQPDGTSKRLSSGPRGENALVTTLWPSNPASMNRSAEITVLVANEIALAN